MICTISPVNLKGLVSKVIPPGAMSRINPKSRYYSGHYTMITREKAIACLRVRIDVVISYQYE
jgi:hypothetical protein